MSKAKTDPCQTQACALQKCLQAHNYQESKCEIYVMDLHRCCRKFWKQSGVCSGIPNDPVPSDPSKNKPNTPQKVPC